MTSEVAVNLLWCVPGVVGGSEEYLSRMLVGLASLDDPDLDVRVAVLEPYRAAHPDVAAAFELESLGSAWSRRPARIVAEHTWLAHRTRHASLVHHGGGTAPLVGRRPIVVTVHDLQYLTFPDYFSSARLRYLRAMMPQTVRRASVLTAPTAYVRNTLVEALDAEPDRVVVVPHGVPEPSPHPEPEVVERRLGIADRPYVVYPAITHPHKRHELLVDLLAGPWRDRDEAVVMLGGAGSADSSLTEAVRRAGVGGRVVRPGRLAAAERDALVARAEAVVFPSRYEGFGAPIVEAMASATPVVCGSHPAVVEVGGEAAVVVDDGAGIDEWADAIDDARRRRVELGAAGLRRAADFSVARSGEALRAAYRLALS